MYYFISPHVMSLSAAPAVLVFLPAHNALIMVTPSRSQRFADCLPRYLRKMRDTDSVSLTA